LFVTEIFIKIVQSLTLNNTTKKLKNLMCLQLGLLVKLLNFNWSNYPTFNFTYLRKKFSCFLSVAKLTLQNTSVKPSQKKVSFVGW